MKNYPNAILVGLTGLAIGITPSSTFSEVGYKSCTNTYNISRIQNENSDINSYTNLIIRDNRENEKQGDIMSVELTENLSTLHQFLELELGWDGEDAKTFNNEFVKFVSSVLMNLEFQPEVFPLQDGGVQLEYGDVSEKYLEFEINSNKTMSVYKIDEKRNKEKLVNVNCTLENVIKEIDWFVN